MMIVPRRTSIAFGLFVALSCVESKAGTVARPWDEDQDEPERTAAIYFVLGVGTPVGLAGLEIVQRLRPAFEISAGIGLGASASGAASNTSVRQVLQWAVMPRWLFGAENNPLTLGAGLSGGQDGGYQIFGQGLNCPEEGPCTYETATPSG